MKEPELIEKLEIYLHENFCKKKNCKATWKEMPKPTKEGWEIHATKLLAHLKEKHGLIEKKKVLEILEKCKCKCVEPLIKDVEVL